MKNSYGARVSRHEQAVLQAEVRRLARSLRQYRILHRDALERACGAEKWHEGGFDRALHEAVKAGALEPLPGGFYRDAEDAQADGVEGTLADTRD
jgi:hypothetical protein